MKLFKILLVLVLFTSCGARKSQVSTVDTKIDSTTIATEQVSIKTESSETLQDTTSIIEEEYEPINDTLPMMIDKKNGVYKNARIKSKKVKSGLSVSKKGESVTNQRKSTLNEVSIDVESKDKVTDKKESFSSWIWLLIIAGIILAYFEMKRK
jgi:hypothetical protein